MADKPTTADERMALQRDANLAVINNGWGKQIGDPDDEFLRLLVVNLSKAQLRLIADVEYWQGRTALARRALEEIRDGGIDDMPQAVAEAAILKLQEPRRGR